MVKIAIIGGSGFCKIHALEVIRREVANTPFGEPSAPVTHGELVGLPVVFLPRHGSGHTIPPHKINYRANLWACKMLGVTHIVSIYAVGGITSEMAPGMIVVPDQIIDYTYGREQTFFESDLTSVTHIDFTNPYDEKIRQALISGAEKADIPCVDSGTYAAVQGPRLETAMEVRRLENDGCDIVGMTGMPEASLARELDIPLAACGMVVNWAAGKMDTIISHQEIEENLSTGMLKVYSVLENALTEILQ